MIKSCKDCLNCQRVRYNCKNTYYCRAKRIRGVLLVPTRITIDWRGCELAEDLARLGGLTVRPPLTKEL